MIYDERGRPRPGIEVDEDGRVLLWYRDQFGRLQRKHLMYCTPTGAVEWRHRDITLVIGVLQQNKGEDEGYSLQIKVTDYKP